MGTMTDTGIPIGLTISGRGWDDTLLIELAAAFEATGNRREEPPRHAATVKLGLNMSETFG